jgi:OOP family OmpA-OmpF porin
VSNVLKIVLGILIFLLSVYFCANHNSSSMAAAMPASGAPAVAEIQIGERVTLTGDVVSQAKLDAVLAAAQARYGADKIDNQLKLATGATGQVLTLRGAVADEDARAQAETAYQPTVSGDTRLNNQLTLQPSVAEQVNQVLTLKNIEFVSGKAVFTAAGQAVADEVAALLANAADQSFEVSGHTDSRGNPAANQALSLARAKAVIEYLGGKGLAQNRFSAKGYGADKPVADNETVEGRQKNRRIEFVRVGG